MPNDTVAAAATGLPDRRLFLATGAAAVVLSTVGKAKAAEMPAATDPIFEALGAERRARGAYDQARAAIRAIRSKHPQLLDGFIFVAKADGDSENVSSIQHLSQWLDQQGPARAVQCKRTVAEMAARVLGIEEPIVADPAPEALAAWEAERAGIVAEFERARQAYDDAAAEAIPAHVYDALDKVADVSEAAIQNVLATVPTSAAGGAALMRYCLEAMERFGDYLEVMPAMENALAAIEGGAAA